MDTSQNTNTFDNSLHTSAEFSKKFTRELAKNLTKVSNNPSKLRDNFICLTHSPNHLLLSKNIKAAFTISPKTPQISAFQEKSTQKSVRNSQNHLKIRENERSPEYEPRGFLTSNKKVYQIGSLSIEKTTKAHPEANKENLLSEIKSLNEKFNMILCSDQKNENISKSSVIMEPEGRKKLGDRTNSLFCKKSEAPVIELDKEIKDFKNFDGLEFETQRKQLEKHNLQKKIEVSSLDREIAKKSGELGMLRKDYEELVIKLREKKAEFQKISIEFDLFFQQCDLKQKQYEFSKQQDNIRFEQERAELETNKQRVDRLEQDLKEREASVIKKERENAEILKEIEGQIQSLDSRKYEINENLKKCYDYEAEFNIRNEKQQEKEKLLMEEKRNIEEKSRRTEDKAMEITRKEKDIANQTETLTEKIQEMEGLEKTLRKNVQENQEKEGHLMRKEKELCKVIEEIKCFSNNLKNEKQQQENRFKGWEEALKKKEEELLLKERLLIEKSCKDEDLELKLIGLKMNEDTFKKKLDLEIKNYQTELQKLMAKEKDLVQREKKIAEYEKKFKNVRGNNNENMNTNFKNNNFMNSNNFMISNNNNLMAANSLINHNFTSNNPRENFKTFSNNIGNMALGQTLSKNVLKNELHKIFNQEKKAHKLQKSQSFIVLRKKQNNSAE